MDPLQKRRLNGMLLGSSCLVASAFIGPALAGNLPPGTHPTGGNVVVGNAKITDHGTKITQTSEKAFIDWNSFSIGSGETVNIKGPNNSAVTVNRVTGVTRSEIDGALRANDNVWLLNGNGILFGKGSIINVGSLIATTSDLSDDDFRKGKYKFKSGGNPNASVINKGTITARDGGTVILSAARVANEGLIQANMGSVVLGGANAFTVDFNGDNLIRYQITSEVKKAPTHGKGEADKALVTNAGRIVADGGTVIMTSRAASGVQDNVINNRGMIEATSVSAHDGEVDLDAGPGGTVNDTGTINVSGTAQGTTGGNVTITGQNINVDHGAHIDARGQAGGGTVLIGGNFHGEGALQQAENVTIGKATINVSATRKGDGGKVAIWSKGQTIVDGTIKAEGGRDGGNGGFIETSGDGVGIGASAFVNTSAVRGAAGTWLIDPIYATIRDCGGSCCGAGLVIDSGAIVTSLNAGSDVTVEAEGGGANSTITVAPNSTITADGSGDLSLLAEGNITIKSSIQNSGTGAINLVAGWDGSTGVTSYGSASNSSNPVNMTAIVSDSGAFGNNNGTVTIGDTGNNGTISVGSAQGTTTVAAANLNVGVAGNVTANDQLGFDGNGGGDIDVYVSGDLTVRSDKGGYAHIGNGNLQYGSSVTQANGDIFLQVGGTTHILANGSLAVSSSYTTAWIGNGVTSGTATGNVTLITGALDVESFSNGTFQTDNTLLGDIVASDLTGKIQSATDGNGGSGGGNVTIAITNSCGTIDWGNYFGDGLDFANGNTLSLLTEGGMIVDTPIQAVENGNINVVAGWDGTTGLSASGIDVSTILSTAGAFGSDGGDIVIGGSGASGNVSVGSYAGTTKVAGDYISLEAYTGTAQIGFAGPGGGDISVTAVEDVTLTGNGDADNSYIAQIGNGGAFNVAGNVTGNITVTAGDDVDVQAKYQSATAMIGNLSGDPSDSVGGSIFVTAGNGVRVAGAYSGSVARIGNANVYSGSIAGGDVSGNITVNATTVSMIAVNDGEAIIGASGSRAVDSNISITTSGDVAMSADSYGSGFVEIGNYTTDAAGTTGNVTLKVGGNLSMYAAYDSYVGIGSRSASSNIKVTVSHDITMYSADCGCSYNYVQIGNYGGRGAHTTAGGNITVTSTHGDITMYNGSAGGTVQIGNGPATYTSGNIVVTAKSGDIDLTSTYGGAVQIGNGPAGADPGKQITGNITVTATNGNITLSSQYKYGVVQIGHGLARDVSGNITVTAGGDISLTSEEKYSVVIIGHDGADGSTAGNITVTAGGAVSLYSAVSVGASVAQIGNGGPDMDGNASGDIVVSGSSLSVTSDSRFAYATIGNGDPWHNSEETGTGSARGNITLNISGLTTIDETGGGDYAWIGNEADPGSNEAGNVTITTGALDVVADGDADGTALGDMIVADLGTSSGTGGDFTLAFTGTTGSSITGATGDRTVSDYFVDGLSFDSPHTLSFLSTNDIDFGASVQNSGNGDIDVVAGWDGTTLDASAFGNDGVYGNNGGSVTIEPGADGAAIGSAGGSTLVAGDDITLDADSGAAQIGYQGSGSGKIAVLATGNVTLTASTDNGCHGCDAQIGDDLSEGGSSVNISVTAGGNVTLSGGDGSSDFAQIGNGGVGDSGDFVGKISVSAGGDVTLTGGGGLNADAQIGNGGATANGDFSGNVTVDAGGNVSLSSGANLHADAQIGNGGDGSSGAYGGNITVDACGSVALEGSADYAQIGNGGVDGSGAADGNITLIAGGNITLTGGSGLHGYAQVGNGGEATDGDDSGTIDVTADGNVTLTGGGANGTAQIGNGGGHMGGDASGNITVDAGNLKLASTGAEGLAMIGNGDAFAVTDAPGKGTGGASGNINITVDGLTEILDEFTPTGTWIGNLADTGTESGNVTLRTADFSDVIDEPADFAKFIGDDLAGGNVTLEFTDTAGTVTIAGIDDYDSANTLKILAAGSLDITHSIQNAGDGAIYVIGGWDGSTVSASQLTHAGVYGNNDGNVTIGGGVVTASVGSQSGKTTVAGDNVTVDGTHGVAQIGWDGTGGGDIFVDAVGNVTVNGSSSEECVNCVALIGNGGHNVGGAITGNISITTDGGNVTLNAPGNDSIATIGDFSDESSSEDSNISIDTNGGAVTLTSSGDESYAQIGNWVDADTATDLSGNITIDAGAITLDSTGIASDTQIGNGTFLNVATSGTVSGDIDIHATSVTVEETSDGFEEARIGNLGSGPVSGNVSVTASGDVLISAGGNGAADIGDYSNPKDESFNDVQGEGSGNVTVNAGGNITLTADGTGSFASIEFGGATSGNVKVTAGDNVAEDASDGGAVLIGSGLFFNGSVNVTVTATDGNITLQTEDADSTVQIGNIEYMPSGTVSCNVKLSAGTDIDVLADIAAGGDSIEIGDEAGSGGTASGNLTLSANGTLDISNAAGSLIGNSGASETGNVAITAVDLVGDIAPSIENDLPGGNFSVVLSGDGTLGLSTDVDVDSSYNLTLSNGGDIVFFNSLLNSGRGNITLDSGADVLIGGANATGSVAVGSASGLTKVNAANLTISGVNGNAQLGYDVDGVGGGDIAINVTGTVSLSGKSGNFAQIGDGSTFESNADGGNITLSAGAVSVSGKADLVGDTAVITIDTGNLGSSARPLDVVVNSLAVDSDGGDAYLTSPDGLSIGVGSKGIDLDGGDLVLSANGPVTQTRAISAGSIDISGSSITLTNTGNRFDDATLTSTGDASLFDSLNLTVDGASVSGTLTLSDAHNIGQSGAIDADSLVVTTNSGNITLNNTGNDFSNATITASGDAFIYDSADLNVAGADVDGTLTLSSGGDIVQSGAIDAGFLDAIANNGSIALTDDDNAVSNITLSADGDATFYDTLSLTVNGAAVGGNLTLLSERNLTFVSSIQLTHGNILAVAGWDGTTTGTAALESMAGAYGNHNGSITVGGTDATGDVSVGSKTGTTTMLGWNVGVEAENGSAQLGYAGAGSGDIVIDAHGAVTLAGGGNAAHTAQIGNGSQFDTSSGGGAVNIAAESIAATGHADIAGNSADIAISGSGGIGSASDPLALAVNDLAIETQGGDVFATSAQGVSIGVGADGVDLNGGDFTLTANGAISQTQAIEAGSIDVDGTAITLTDSANSFADATVTASGNASLADSVNLTVDGADVGGTLTLTDSKNVGQSGAIVAKALDVTANKITLDDAGNSIARANLTSSGNASLFDASDLIVTGADVGGTLTLAGGGDIGQSGAITSAALDVTTSNGSITLTDASNSFASADLTASGDASLADGVNLTITGADVGGTLTMTDAENIGQSGAITAKALDVTANKITLTNAGNSFAKANVTASGDASVTDGANLTITGADVGGTLTLTGSKNIGQSGAITADALDVTTSNGSIALTNANNSIADADLASSGNASLSDASALTIIGADVGGTLTLESGGSIGQSGAITAAALDVTSNGQITLTNTSNSFADADVNSAGAASLYDASNLVITGASVGGTLTLTGAKNIGQSGAIAANALAVTTNHGSIALNNAGNNVASAKLTASGNASLADSANLTITGADVGGTLTLTGAKSIGQSGAITAKTVDATANGSIELTGLKNAIGTATLSAGGDAALFDTSSLTVDGASAGGNLTLLTEGDLTFVKSVQLDNGNLIAAAGWNGKATDLADLTNDAGSNGGTITIGGTGASGDVAVGSQHGTTTLIGEDVSLEADKGYAQIGYNGAGTGNINIIASGNVTLGGGADAGDFAQIGNGGMGVSGNESGNITVDAGGAVTLDGGKGKDAYAQIGHGGADADKNSSGYTNSGNITVLGQTVALVAGGGDESYAQIGQGGFEIGEGLTGKATNEGNITITVTDRVSLSGGGGNDSYSQIGNGGDQSNKNASSGASGSDTGNITVDAGSGTVDTAAGAGTNAYTQIGNGGFDANDGGNAANFDMSGNISVSDLTLLGSNTGTDAYAQVGNGDASENSTGNAGGDITIDAGTITVTNGKANGAAALIGNATGHGTVSGTITGYTQNNNNNTDAGTQGSIQSTQSTTTQANTQQVDLIVTTPPTGPGNGEDNSNSQTTGPLGNLSDNTEASGDQTSDAASNDLGRSLNGHDSNVQTVALIPGVLTEVVSRQTPRGIPLADQNFSSWGNEALWRW